MSNVTKLPKWAQEYIATIKRERDTAVRSLNEWVDAQTPQPFFVDEMECLGEQRGPSIKRRYFEGTRVVAAWQGIRLDVTLADDGIRLQWADTDRDSREVGLVPTAFQYVRLVSKENMR